MEYKSARDIWSAALGELQVQVSKSNYKTWLEKTSGVSYEDNRFVVAVPNTFIAEYLDKNQRSLIEKTLIGLVHQDVELVFRIEGIRRTDMPGANRQTDSPSLNSNYTFDSFVVGVNNQLAFSAAREITERPGQTYNPLLICGGPGLGKTHLLQAIGHQAVNNHLHVLYASGEQYTNEFVRALKDNRTEEFRSKYRSAEMLLIDDIDFITGKGQTEESLFHTLNELQNAHRQIAATSDCPPKGMPKMGDKLRSRLDGGLIADIQAPDMDTRIHILEVKAKQKGVDLSPDTLELIAQRIRQNIRELEGSLNRVIAYARLIRDAITPELAAQALDDIGGKKEKPVALCPQLLIEAVAGSFQISPVDLKGTKRDKETAVARQMAMYVLRHQLNCSLSQIGQELGGRNPSTVTHACRKIGDDLSSSLYLQEKLNDIQQRLDNSRDNEKG